MMAYIAIGGAAAVLFTVAYADWQYRRIPHWQPATLVVCWVVATVATRPDLLVSSLLTGLACGALALFAGAAFRWVGWLGGGDVKLLAALALWLGPLDFGLALLAAGVLTLILAGPAFALAGDMARRGLPLACAIAPPAAVLLLWRAADLAVPSGVWPTG